MLGADDVEFMFDVVAGATGCCSSGGLAKACSEANRSSSGLGGEMSVAIAGRGEWHEGEWALCIHEKVDGSSQIVDWCQCVGLAKRRSSGGRRARVNKTDVAVCKFGINLTETPA